MKKSQSFKNDSTASRRKGFQSISKQRMPKSSDNNLLLESRNKVTNLFYEGGGNDNSASNSSSSDLEEDDGKINGGAKVHHPLPKMTRNNTMEME